ncbi:MAG TPA: hypothetical protein GX714_10545 [Chloroflexi bacterium]|jgi:hypothetical protein|nr:hypothetical protein [Chloroflexota bacterium]
MDPETIVYLIRDRQGQVIVLTTLEEAQELEIPEVPGIEEQSFGWVLEHHPRALVCIWCQYDYAHELAEPV